MAKHDKEKNQEQESAFRRQVGNIIETQINRYPTIVQLRAVWRQLQDEDAIAMPIIVALLVVVFVGTYRSERNKVRRLLAEKKKN